MSTATFDVKFRNVKDSVGNITLQPVQTDEGGKRAATFRKQIEYYIARARNSPDPIRAWFDIGPIEAGILLEFSNGNRKESMGTVEMYQRDIESGAWMKTHQGFAISRSGWLGDGHHRCLAIIESGKTVRVSIDFGVDDAALAAVDMGRGRSISDQLALLRGIKNAKKSTAALRVCIALAAGTRHLPKRSLTEIEVGFTAHTKAIEALAQHIGAKYPGAFWGTLLYAYPAAPQIVVWLAKRVIHGEGLTGAAYTLREYLEHAGRAQPFEVAQRTLYTLRALVENRELTKFSPRSDSVIFDWAAAQVAKKAA